MNTNAKVIGGVMLAVSVAAMWYLMSLPDTPQPKQTKK